MIRTVALLLLAVQLCQCFFHTPLSARRDTQTSNRFYQRILFSQKYSPLPQRRDAHAAHKCNKMTMCSEKKDSRRVFLVNAATIGSGMLSSITTVSSAFASEEPDAKAKALAKQMAVVTFTKKIDEGTEKAFKLAKKGDLLGALQAWNSVIAVYETGGDGVVLGPQALYRLGKTLGQRADIQAELGKQKKDAKYFTAAIEDYRKSLKMVPQPELRIKLATALQALGDNVEAEKEFTAVLAGGPGNEVKGRALNSRGLVRERLGKWNDAVADFQEAVEATRGTPEAQNNLALAKFQIGDSKGAIEVCKGQLNLAGVPEGAEDLPAALAAMEFATGEQDKALKDLAKVTDPRYRDIRYVKEGRLWPPKLVEAHTGLLNTAKAAASAPPAPTAAAAAAAP